MAKNKFEVGTNPETGKPYFQRLGRDNQHNAWYLKDNGTVICTSNKGITKSFLLNIADYWYWNNASYASAENENGKMRCNWDFAISTEQRESDFQVIDPSKFVGVGAYRFKDGSVGFFDGDRVVMACGGRYTNQKDNVVFVRRCKLDLGFNEKPVTLAALKELESYCQQMVFKNESDIIALLGLCCQMTVCGALEWRAAGAITGPSTIGKSTILNTICKTIVRGKYYNGKDTSAAGIRQDSGPDAIAILVDEFDHENKYDEKQRADIIALMRQSSSNDSPDIVKGSQSQTGSIKYRCRSNFLFAGIDPSMGKEQDENRIIFIRLEEKSQEQKKNYQEVVHHQLKELMNENFARGLFSRIWKNMDRYIECEKNTKKKFREIGVRSERRIDVWSGIVSMFYIIFRNHEPDMSELVRFIAQRDETQDEGDENENLLNKMLDTILKISDSSGSMDKTIRSMLAAGNMESVMLERYGFSVKNGFVYIENGNNFWEGKLFQKKYHRLFERISYCQDKNVQKWMNSKNRRCTVFRYEDLVFEKNDTE